jgi:hypothetical protein
MPRKKKSRREEEELVGEDSRRSKRKRMCDMDAKFEDFGGERERKKE